MIKVTVELISAIDGHREILGEAKIYNDTTGTPTRGNYGFQLFGKKRRLWKEGSVKGFPRKQKLAWHLLQECLNSSIHE